MRNCRSQRQTNYLKFCPFDGILQKPITINARYVKPGSTLPLNVEFHKENDKWKVLNNKLLLNSKFHWVNVFQDHTYNHIRKYSSLKWKKGTMW